MENNEFWVENRRYIQKDRFVKYNLFKRLELWVQINEQLNTYNTTLTNNIRVLDSVIQEKENEWTLIWWWGRNQAGYKLPRNQRRRNPRTRNSQLTRKIQVLYFFTL